MQDSHSPACSPVLASTASLEALVVWEGWHRRGPLPPASCPTPPAALDLTRDVQIPAVTESYSGAGTPESGTRQGSVWKGHTHRRGQSPHCLLPPTSEPHFPPGCQFQRSKGINVSETFMGSFPGCWPSVPPCSGQRSHGGELALLISAGTSLPLPAP